MYVQASIGNFTKYPKGIPSIGTGNRRIIVEKEGRRWVKLINPYTLDTARITKAQWDDTIKTAIKPNIAQFKRGCLLSIKAIDRWGLAACATESDEKRHAGRMRGLCSRYERALKAIKEGTHDNK